MRGSRWRAFLLALLVGPGSAAADIDAGDLDDSWADGGRGHAVHGSHFYVWEETQREAEAWANELERSHELERSDGVSPLGSVLCLLPALDRTCLVAAWASSPDERARRAIARALSAPFEAVGVRGALDHLQRDPSLEVRRLARLAAELRGLPLSGDSPLS